MSAELARNTTLLEEVQARLARRTPWQVIGLAVLALVLLRIPYYGKILLDDPFITYRYAENLLAYGQLVFNPGEPVLATTTPLYALIMTVFGSVGLPIPAASSVFNLLCEAVLLAVLYGIIRSIGLARWQTDVAFGLTALLVIIDRSFSVASWGGMETPLFVLLLFATLLQIIQRRYSRGAVTGSLATLTRPDGIIVLALLAGVMLVRERRLAWRQALIALAIGLPWVIFAWSTYGTFIPQSVTAKNAIIPIWDNAVSTKLTILLYWPLRWFGVFAVLPLAYGLLRSIKPARNPSAMVMAAFGLLQLAYLFLPNNPGFDWYFVPAVVTAYCFIGLGLVQLLDNRRWVGIVCGAGIAAGLAFSGAANSLSVLTLDRDWRDGMVKAVDYLNASAEPGSTVQSTNIGILGYGTRFHILDPLGLASPEVLPLFGTSESLQALTLAVAAQFQPDYVVTFGESEYPSYMIAAAFPNSTLTVYVLQREDS
ncbi:MAG: hypothetical protein JNL34_05795 [Anaerolineae bacterium]|nr:hypothetical protein [Anaerolineae bacterium]